MTDRAAPVIDAALVRGLIAGQFPQWAHLPVRPVEPGGWDNRTFHLGDGMSVRLPSGPGYAAQVDKEHRHLPRLAPQLPVPVPEPLALGEPGAGYPWRWSVYRWLDGETADASRIADMTSFAGALAGFLTALRAADPTGGPPPAAHGGFRGGPLTTYDGETRRALDALGGRVDCATASAVWQAGLDAAWDGRPVWFHGDFAHGNLLVRDGRLAAVIDFGCSGVGDPACDTSVAWTLLDRDGRTAFRTALAVDDGTWARGRAWVLWKALIVLAGADGTDPAGALGASGRACQATGRVTPA